MVDFKELADKMCINPAIIDKYEEDMARDDVIDDIRSDGDKVYIRSTLCMD